VLVLLLCACPEAAPSFGDVCSQATDTIERCGASVPEISGAPCTGIAEQLSRCVIEHSHSCDDLAALMRHPEQCEVDAGEDLLPDDQTELPVPAPHPLDGGVDAGQ
jgi:hypothetical protein